MPPHSSAKGSVLVDTEGWFSKRSFNSWHLVCLVSAIAVFWSLFILAMSVNSHYGSLDELRFFKSASIGQIFAVMDFSDTYKRFSPLGFGLIGWLDAHVYIPLLGKAGVPLEQLVVARRLVWLHPILVGVSCFVTAGVVWQVFKDQRLVAIAVLLLGLSDTVPYQMRFVSTLVCYMLQITAVMAFYYLVRLDATRSTRAVTGLTICVIAALSLWEQGLDLAFAAAVALALAISSKRRTVGSIKALPETRALVSVISIAAIYLVIRLKSGASEALTSNNEASYFFGYRKLLPMIDDLILNFSALTLQATRQMFPFPPLALSVMSSTDMNTLNIYNTTYAQFPNMFYRMMGLWYSGISFAVTIAGLLFVAGLAKVRQGSERRLIIGALCIYVFGFVMHLPIMHRDYFYIPGYALGFKISIGYIGFVLLVLVIAREVFSSEKFRALSDRAKAGLYAGIAAYFCLAAVSRAILGQLPNRFPW